MTWEIVEGDAYRQLQQLSADSVQCVVTSPPYYGLRDYGIDGQLGLETTPEQYVKDMVKVFREVRRVLRDDGTLWLNIGDSYAATRSYQVSDSKHKAHGFGKSNASALPPGCKPKDLIGIPWMLAFALRADGWFLRSEIIWAKPNAMPESVRDRPTNAHEKLFLLTKSERYFYDAEAIKEPLKWPEGPWGGRNPRAGVDIHGGGQGSSEGFRDYTASGTRNKRNVWEIVTEPYAEAHFATFPTKLVEPCVLAGTDTDSRCVVLDPFAGSGTVGVVCEWHGRDFIGIELNPEYAELAERRIAAEGRLTRKPQKPKEAQAEVLFA